jgi:hypothetical protein
MKFILLAWFSLSLSLSFLIHFAATYMEKWKVNRHLKAKKNTRASNEG